jgi:hypothetical protein
VEASQKSIAADQTLEVLGVPIEVAELSRKLHAGRTAGLEIEVSTDILNAFALSNQPGWSVGENRLAFSSLQFRNQCVAALFHQEWRNSGSDPNQTFAISHQLRCNEIGHDDQACGRFLALVHQATDVFQAGTAWILQDGVNVFSCLHAIGAAFRYLDITNFESLIDLVEAQHEKTKNEFAGGVFFQQLETAISASPQSCRALHLAVVRRISLQNGGLYLATLRALARSGAADEAIVTAFSEAESGDHFVRMQAVAGVALLISHYEVAQENTSESLKLLRSTVASSNDELRSIAIRGIGHAAQKHEELYGDLLLLAKSGDQLALYAISNHLSANWALAKAHPRFIDLVRALCLVSEENKAALDDFDWILSHLLGSTEFVDLGVECLTNWMSKHSGPVARDRDVIDAFDQTVLKLAETPTLLSRIITSWFVSDSPQLGSACGGLVRYLEVRNLEGLHFSSEVLDGLDAASLKYLARRMLGHVYSERQLLSLTFSLLNTVNAKARTFGLVHTLLATEVGRDFVGTTLDALKLKIEVSDSELRSLFESVHSEISSYTGRIDSLPRLQELKAPHRLRRLLATRRMKQLNESMERENEKSVLRQLATQIPLKAGIGWFSVTADGVGQTSRLQSISHSVALPMRAVNDPVGYEIRGLQYRYAKKGDE